LITNITADGNAEGLNVEVHEEFVPSPIVTIGKYTHAQHYRDGLFSSVFKAHKPGDLEHTPEESSRSPSLVALKVTTPSLMESPHDSVREARILASNEHDHVIPLLDSFRQAGGSFVLVLPFVPYDLADLLQKGCLNRRQITSTVRDLFSALAYLHSHGIIHRDVKPSNILLSSFDGPSYLADFGIAWSPRDAASEKPNEKITDVGTTSYRAPELLFGNTSYNQSLDLWAAGCVVAETMSKPHKTLFESGDLGSELALIQSIFKTLGTPTTATWPVSVHLP
jgi:serine/threonine protein kinase